MEVLYLLIPLALVLVVIIGGALFWAIRSGQFEDMEGPAYRILMDDDDPRIPRESADSTDVTDETRLPVADSVEERDAPPSRPESAAGGQASAQSEFPKESQGALPSGDSSKPPSPPSERS